MQFNDMHYQVRSRGVAQKAVHILCPSVVGIETLLISKGSSCKYAGWNFVGLPKFQCVFAKLRP